MADSDNILLLDGSLDFSGGVNSVKVTTIQSELNPVGLARNELAWLSNATMRDGGINPRAGWTKVATIGSGLFQGAFTYEPLLAFPYDLVAIDGRILKVDWDSGVTQDLTATFGEGMPATEPYFHFVQADQFAVIQAGDFVTKPIFWDGTTMRRSIGIVTDAPTQTPGQNEIPAAGAMEYFMGRIWYAQGRFISGSDIIYGSAGTAAYNFRDAVLNVTENPLSFGGDGFAVPAYDGDIRCIKTGGAIDAALGEGRLFIGTRKAWYSLQVPVNRTDWIGANNSTQPLMTVVQLVNGPVNDRSAIVVNGDIYYQSLEPGIRSLAATQRYFSQPGNIQISANEQRILQFNNRALLRFSSGIVFNDRMLQTALPTQTDQGVVHPALVPMDFIPFSSFNMQKAPIWEGHYEGLQIFQMLTGDFGGRQRAHAYTRNTSTGEIEMWELTFADNFDNGDNRIQWYLETPAYTWNSLTKLKKLVGCDIWVDRLMGTVYFKLDWRPDSATCWIPWHQWQECSPKNSAEDVNNPVTYPLTEFGPCYRATMTLPEPPKNCAPCGIGRPATIAYQHQLRLTILGKCRLRGIWLRAQHVERETYNNIVC